MGQAEWEAPRTEAGFQKVLNRLEECRGAGDLVETGNGLLQLSFLVKWVRSDTDQAPFDRSQALALEALEIFRAAEDKKGQVRALIAAIPMANAITRDRMLSEADKLSEAIGDESLIAMTVSARARALAFSDRVTANDLHHRALEIYRRTENRKGLARTLFSLSIGEDGRAQKRDYAIEAAQIYRALGEPSDASRCMMIAMMNAEEIDPMVELEGLAREGLQDALNAGKRTIEKYFYDKLAMIADSKGEIEEAEKYRRWANDLQDSDGLTPYERWENNVEMTKLMIAAFKTQGNREEAKKFQEELKRLKRSKPRK
jgi:hypothetical protein